MPTYVLTPTVANDVANWSNESDALSEDNLWAVNSNFASTKLVLEDFTGSLPGTDEVILGIEIACKVGNVSNTGSPGTVPETEDVRIRIGISKDGSSFAGTYYDIDCSAVVETTLGSPTDLMGTTWVASDFSSIYLLFQRPTDLANEFTGGNRSVDYGSITVYTSESSGLEILSADGGCDGEVDISWAG